MNMDKELQNLINEYMPKRYYGHEARRYAGVIAKLYAEQQLKLFTILNVTEQSEQLICHHCGKYKGLQGNGIMHQLCECGEDDVSNPHSLNEELVYQLSTANIMLRFKLRLNVDTWGSYKKGDEDFFYIKLLDEQNGLVRFPIDKQWDIVNCEIIGYYS